MGKKLNRSFSKEQVQMAKKKKIDMKNDQHPWPGKKHKSKPC
jgi:hypothetical protein